MSIENNRFYMPYNPLNDVLNMQPEYISTNFNLRELRKEISAAQMVYSNLFFYSLNKIPKIHNMFLGRSKIPNCYPDRVFPVQFRV